MDIIKNLAYAVFPLHSDIKRDNKGEIVNDDKNMGFVWTKRGIATGLTLLSIALVALAALAFTGILPVGMVGFYILAGAAGAAIVANVLYLLGLAGGRRRSNAILKKDSENKDYESIRQVVMKRHNKRSKAEGRERRRQAEYDKAHPPAYYAYGTPQIRDTFLKT